MRLTKLLHQVTCSREPVREHLQRLRLARILAGNVTTADAPDYPLFVNDRHCNCSTYFSIWLEEKDVAPRLMTQFPASIVRCLLKLVRTRQEMGSHP